MTDRKQSAFIERDKTFFDGSVHFGAWKESLGNDPDANFKMKEDKFLEWASSGIKLSTSLTFTLQNAGDRTPVIDLTTLDPPVKAKELFVEVLEKGTAGGEFLFQTAYFGANQILATRSSAYSGITVVDELDKAYAIPRNEDRVAVIDLIAKNANKIGPSLGFGGVKFFGNGSYNPANGWVLAPTDGSSATFAVRALDDLVVTGISIGTGYNAIIPYQDGWLVGRFTGSGTIKQVTVTGTTFNVTDLNSTAINAADLQIYKTFLYVFTYGQSLVYRLDLNNPSAGYTSFPCTPVFVIGGVELGNKAYHIPYVSSSGSGIRIWDFDTNTEQFIALPSGRQSYFNPVLFNNKILGFGNGNSGNEVLEIDPATNTFSYPATVDYAGFVDSYKGNVVASPLNPSGPQNVPIEFLFEPPFAIPANPFPYQLVQNNFGTNAAANQINTTDYIKRITEDGAGNATGLEIEKMKAGQVEITVNIKSGGF